MTLPTPHRARTWGTLATLTLIWALTCRVAQALAVSEDRAAPADSAVVYVARRGWHIDIGFAASDLAPPLNSLTTDFPGVQYLFFGFGDRHYLMSKNHAFPAMLAALWPGMGMILATALAASPKEAFGAANVIPVRVTRAQGCATQAFVLRSLSTSSVSTPGPYAGSLYFSAVPRYSALHTCNTWAAEALKAGGLPIRSAGVAFAGQLWSQTRRLDRPDAPPKPSAFPDARGAIGGCGAPLGALIH